MLKEFVNNAIFLKLESQYECSVNRQNRQVSTGDARCT